MTLFVLCIINVLIFVWSFEKPIFQWLYTFLHHQHIYIFAFTESMYRCLFVFMWCKQCHKCQKEQKAIFSDFVHRLLSCFFFFWFLVDFEEPQKVRVRIKTNLFIWLIGITTNEWEWTKEDANIASQREYDCHISGSFGINGKWLEFEQKYKNEYTAK